MFVRIFIFFSLVVAAGCATTENYEKMLRTWEGRNINDLIAEWGYPVNSYKSPNETTIYVYNSASTYTTPVQVSKGPGGSFTTYGGQTFNYSCQTFFEVDENKIIMKWEHKGNNCKL